MYHNSDLINIHFHLSFFVFFNSLQEKILEILIFLHIYYDTLYMHDLNDAWPGRIPRIGPHPPMCLFSRKLIRKVCLMTLIKDWTWEML